MTEWVKYTGSPEQIDEMINAAHGFICKNEETESGILTIKYGQLFSSMSHYPILNAMWDGSLKRFMDNNNTTNYLTCNPHPLEDMICQQARTGQEVYIKVTKQCLDKDRYQFVEVCIGHSIYVTTTPDWCIPGADYSFTPFEEEL